MAKNCSAFETEADPAVACSRLSASVGLEAGVAAELDCWGAVVELAFVSFLKILPNIMMRSTSMDMCMCLR